MRDIGRNATGFEQVANGLLKGSGVELIRAWNANFARQRWSVLVIAVIGHDVFPFRSADADDDTRLGCANLNPTAGVIATLFVERDT